MRMEVENGAEHTAAIIPINSQLMDFRMPWADCLQPIAPDFLSIERTVLECATAGCKTIWVICPYEIQSLLRHRLGDCVQDPVWYNRKYVRRPNANNKEIPIYFIPVHSKDRDKRDSVVWNMLYGCLAVEKLCKQMSRWLIPQKYYISFPNVVYPSQFVRKYRDDITKRDRFLISHNGETIMDGKHLPATITMTDVKFLLKKFREQATGLWDGNSPKRGHWPSEKHSLENRYSGRYITVKDIFQHLEVKQDTKIMTTSWFYSLDSWASFCEYIGSKERLLISRPKQQLLKYKEWGGIANVELL